MKIKKTLTEKAAAANRRNSLKSTGPTTSAGKRRSRMNALKHGLFASELQVGEEDRPEFEVLRNGLLHQFAPATAMQHIAFEQVVNCCWRCKRALRIETRAASLQIGSMHEPAAKTEDEPIQLERWYGQDYRSLHRALRSLQNLREDVAENGPLHLTTDERLKESIIKGFGSDFYGRLFEWKEMSVDEILMVEHITRHRKIFGSMDKSGTLQKNPPNDTKVVVDPKLKWQMVVKLVEVEIEHLTVISRIKGRDLAETPLALAEFSPRYYAAATRDLERVVDWFLKVKALGL